MHQKFPLNRTTRVVGVGASLMKFESVGRTEAGVRGGTGGMFWRFGGSGEGDEPCIEHEGPSGTQ